MTNEEKLKILEEAETRAYEELTTLSGHGLASEDCLNLLHSIEELRWAQERVKRPVCTAMADEFPFAHLPKNPDDPAPVVAEERTHPDPEPETEPDPEEPKPPTKSQMVTKLTAYQSNGVAIDEVMKGMGYGKLSQVPETRYWELLEKCQKIADGEG